MDPEGPPVTERSAAQPTVLTVQVGLPRTRRTAAGASWRSAILKERVVGPVYASRAGLTGDRQANLRVHGGPDKAICCHAWEHYPLWQEIVGEPLPPGGLGENFTTRGWDEETACIGDVARIGTALVEVSQPRVPCLNIARRWESPALQAEIGRLGFAGFYLRVLEEGEVASEDAVVLQQRRHPGYSIGRVNEILFGASQREESLTALLALEALSTECKFIAERIRIRHREAR